MEKQEIEILRAELQTKINKMGFCWVCGRKNHITEHHIIHQYIKEPIMNLKIPICMNCTHIIHKDNEFMALLRRYLNKA